MPAVPPGSSAADFEADAAGQSFEARRDALGRAADAWGADWSPPEEPGRGGRLVLPVLAGLRRGHLLAEVDCPPGAPERIVVRVVAEHLRLNRAAVAVLVVSAAAALLTFLWPFAPGLRPLLPAAAVLAFTGWFLVVQRLRASGVEEFLASVLAELEAPPEADSPAQQH